MRGSKQKFANGATQTLHSVKFPKKKSSCMSLQTSKCWKTTLGLWKKKSDFTGRSNGLRTTTSRPWLETVGGWPPAFAWLEMEGVKLHEACHVHSTLTNLLCWKKNYQLMTELQTKDTQFGLCWGPRPNPIGHTTRRLPGLRVFHPSIPPFIILVPQHPFWDMIVSMIV